MAEYKVIQDIEAEDKLLGPLSLRQFIYAGIAALLGYLSFIAVSKGAAFLLVIFVPPMLFCAFFAWPWSPDQPTEVWALARIRFFLKPRKRIWDQSGMKDLVTITVPKHIEKTFTDGLSQLEVRSRLTALADTIDSRGWAVKNANVNIAAAPTPTTADTSDRLVPTATMPQPVNDIDIQAGDDMLDEQSNPIAQQFDQMIQASSKAYRDKLINKLHSDDTAEQPKQAQDKQPPADYWFMNQPAADQEQKIKGDNTMFANPTTIQPGLSDGGPQAAEPTAAEEEVANKAAQDHEDQKHKQTMHLKTITPASEQPAPPVPPAHDPAILGLAGNDDFDVATLARQAKQAREPESPDDEVVIPLR